MASSALERLASTWKQRVRGRVEQAALGMFLAALLVAAHVGRLGTASARLGAGALVGVTVLAWLLRSVLDRRDWRHAAGIVRRTILRTDRALGERTLRAVRLAERADRDSHVGSAELAHAHLDRLLNQASVRALESVADRTARRWQLGGWLVLGAVLLASLLAPTRVVEGLDVLVAYGQRAPLDLVWLDDTEAAVQPPAYLHLENDWVALGSTAEVAWGSNVVVRGVPRRGNQSLVLSDGRREVSFADDGSGRLTATWHATADARLTIAARFGDVLIEEPEALDIQVVVDTPPRVVLHGVPSTVRFGQQGRLELRYSADDDHGLTQIDLVLRSGDREERRVLAHLDGTSRFEGGATALAIEASFLRRAFLPVLVAIEARDNNDLNGAQWGKSESILVAMPAVGAPEAQRFDALSRAVTPLVRLLASELEQRSTAQGTTAEPPAPLSAKAMKGAGVELKAALERTYLGLGVPRGLSAFLNGQVRRLERTKGTAKTRVHALELVLLSLDGALQALAERDAVAVSRKLADIAEDAASAADQSRTTEREELGIARSQAAALALSEGSTELSRLGDLGADLGTVSLMDHARLSRALRERNMLHAALIARHIAARLRRADASFSGGGTGTAAVESGRGGTTEAPSQASDADTQFDQSALDLEQLIEEHRSNMTTVEESVVEARLAIDELEWGAEAGRLARNIRDQAAHLPRVSAEARNEEDTAFAREHAEAMADALDELAIVDAVASGRDAQSSLETAQRGLAQLGHAKSDDARAVKGTLEAVQEGLRWAILRNQDADRLAAERARGALRDAAGRERDLAGRAGDLAERGSEEEGSLPERTVLSLRRAQVLMEQAGAALNQSQAGQALELQRQAQDALEQASTGRTTDPVDPEQTESPQGRRAASKSVHTEGSVAKPAPLDEAARFRERVLRGLGRPESTRLAPAVRRYAEELLK